MGVQCWKNWPVTKQKIYKNPAAKERSLEVRQLVRQHIHVSVCTFLYKKSIKTNRQNKKNINRISNILQRTHHVQICACIQTNKAFFGKKLLYFLFLKTEITRSNIFSYFCSKYEAPFGLRSL